VSRSFVLAIVRALPIALALAAGVDARAEEQGTAGRTTARPVEEIVVRGVRPQRLAPRTSAFATIVRVDDERGEHRSVADLLGDQVGVQVRRFGGPGESAEVSIRGSTGSQVVTSLDGVRIDSVLTGGTDVSQLCLGLIESAAITRGGDSLRSGEGAIGGSVALRSRRPGPVPVSRMRASGGAFGTWEGDLLHSGRAGALEYGLGYCGFRTEGDYRFARPDIRVQSRPATERPPLERINNERVRHSASLSLGGEVAGGYLRFSDHGSYGSRGEPGLDTGDDVLGGQNPHAHSRDTWNLARLGWSADDLGARGHSLEASLHHRYQALRFDDPGVTAIDAPVSTRTDVHGFGADLRDVWSVTALGGEHALRLWADAERDVLYAPDRSDRGRTRLGAAVEPALRFWDERLAVAPGVRLAWVQGVGETWLPGLGVVVTPLPWLRLKGNVQRSFRAPSFDELYLPDKGFLRGNPDLDPEEARNADVGLVLAFARLGPLSELRLEGGLFQQDIDDSIVFVPVSPRTVEPNNTGPARVRGYELALSFALTRFVRVRANHTGLESESRTTGRPLPGRAGQQTYVRLELGERERWKLAGEMQRTAEIPVSSSGAIRLPARILWSATAGIDLAGFEGLPLPAGLGRLWLYATLRNIGDVAVRDGLFFPQPGRSGFLGTEIEW